MPALKRVLRVGQAAYWDSLSGAIPCKVEAIKGESGCPNSNQRVTIQLTEAHGPYRAGERFDDLWALAVFPKTALRVGEHGIKWIRPYTVEASAH